MHASIGFASRSPSHFSGLKRTSKMHQRYLDIAVILSGEMMCKPNVLGVVILELMIMSFMIIEISSITPLER